MDTAFFVVSKLLGMVLQLETWFLGLAVLAFWASLRGRLRIAQFASALLALLILGIGLLPIGDVLLHPLETRFPVREGLSRVNGIVVLGGGEDVPASRRSGQPQLGEGGDRYVAAIALAKSYPEARLLFAGGSGRLRDMVDNDVSEADIATEVFRTHGIANQRILFENQSRNTAENARLSHALVKPKKGDRWVLITSAFHMPRAVASFKAAGWHEITPFPVDFRTRRWRDGLGWNFSRNLGVTNLALREWAGRAAYSLAGR